MTVALMMVGCKSREEKAAELIKQEMFKTLYDFESYEPIETKLDSAYTSIYTDSVIKSYAYIARAFLDEVQEGLNKVEDAQRTVEIWGDSYSSYGRSQYNEAYNEMRKHLDEVKSKMNIVHSYIDSIKSASSKFKSEFYGWKATHKFRCKTKGGNFDLGNYLYVFDKKMERVLYTEDLDNQDNSRLIEMINEAIKSDNTKEDVDTTTSATEQAASDSLSKALKGNI